MKYKQEQYIILLLLFICMPLIAAVDDIRSVIAFIGHGARAPLQNFTVFDKRVTWPYGYGMPTPAGYRQSYLLGRLLRKNYIENSKLLSKSLNLSEIYFRASQNDRNILSAESFSLGLYPDESPHLTVEQLQNESLWSPPFETSFPSYVKTDLGTSASPYDIPLAPIISYNSSCEQLLNFSECPKFTKEWSTFFSSKSFQELVGNYSGEITKLCTMYEIDCNKLKTGETLFYFVDYLIAAEFEGKLEELTETPLLKNVTELYADMYKKYLSQKNTTKSIVLHNFSAEIPNNFDRIIANDSNSYKFITLSTDELNILSYLHSLGYSNTTKTIPFGSYMIIELKRNPGNWTFNVSVSFNGAPVIPNISYKEFKDNIRIIGNTTGNWTEMCNDK